jgi:hypothetical protein
MLQELDLMRRKEESRQNILHSGGRRFWSLKKLLKFRRRMVTLSEKMVLLDTYSFLNQAGNAAAADGSKFLSYNSAPDLFSAKINKEISGT